MKVGTVKFSDIAANPNLSLDPKDYISDESTSYTVYVEVNGVIDVAVNANSPEEAERKANAMVAKADFGDLSYVEWRPAASEDEDGNRVEY